MSVGEFASSFLNSFLQAKQQKQLLDQDKQERQAKLKLFEIQLQREKQQLSQAQGAQDAQQQLFEKLTGSPAAGSSAAPGADAPAKPPSLTELLADPQNAALFLRSGMLKSDDVLQQENNSATRKMIEGMMGGGGGTPGAVVPGTGGGSAGPARMELNGLKMGPNGQLMPDFGLPQITTQTVDTPNGPRIQTFNPRSGQQVADLGAAKQDQVTPDTAGRVSGLAQAQDIATQVASKFVKPDGSIDRQLVMTSFARVPGSKGRQIRDDLSIAIDSVLRARTGAGVNKEEMKQVVDQFLPSPLDGDAEILNKMNRLGQFIGGTLDAVTLPPSFKKRIQQSGGLPSGIPQGSRQIGTSKGKAVYETPDGKRLIVD